MQAKLFKRTFNQALGVLVLGAAVVAQPAAALGEQGAMAQAERAPISQVLPSTGAPTASQYFAPTGRTVSGDFLSTFQQYGLDRLGYPLSDEQT
jgi:hypothetical protein